MGLNVFILAGRRTGLEIVKYLLNQDGHCIVGVASEEYEGLVNDSLSCDDYVRLLQSRNIPFWETDKIHEGELVSMLSSTSSDVGLRIGWLRLVKGPIISIPSYGFINFHTSYLPKYRGFASTSWAIWNGA